MKKSVIDMNPQSHPYPETTMFGAIKAAADRTPNAIAYDFEGKLTSFKKFIKEIETAAKAYYKIGIRSGDTVAICMPNMPQAVVSLYALNRIGAVANMIHPLSAPKNITYYLNYSDSKIILCLDAFYDKVKSAVLSSDHPVKIITTRIQEELPIYKAIPYTMAKGKPFLDFPDRDEDIAWNDFIKLSKGVTLPPVNYVKDKTAVMLYSGGTTGIPKGICLSDDNFNCLGMQIAEIAGCNLNENTKFLAVMPIFHGFGLGIGIHTVLENSARCILIPQFTKETYAKAVIKKKPNFIAGVPTIFEALLGTKAFKNADLSFLIGVFSGGDKLTPDLKKRVDTFFKEHNAKVQIREGYGLTEAIAASCVTPDHKAKEGSIGKPVRDMVFKIVKPNTFKELPNGKCGEIIMSGPTVMLSYLNHEEENEKTLKYDKNGTKWLFTGDLGHIDDEGYIYFEQRIKRMIVSSGYNVYPTQVEACLEEFPHIEKSCVIGVKDPYKMQRVRAYIVLKKGFEPTDDEKEQIIIHCKKHLDHSSVPKEIIFKESLPHTLVGKVAYRELEEEALKEAE